MCKFQFCKHNQLLPNDLNDNKTKYYCFFHIFQYHLDDRYNSWEICFYSCFLGVVVHFSWIHFFGNSKTRYMRLFSTFRARTCSTSNLQFTCRLWSGPYMISVFKTKLEMKIIWCWSSASDSCVEWISFSRWKWLVTFWRIVIFLICTFVVSGYVMSHWRVIFFIFCRKIWHICNQNIFRILFLILCNLILRLADIFSSGKFDVSVSVKILTSACDQVRKEVEVGVLGFCTS